VRSRRRLDSALLVAGGNDDRNERHPFRRPSRLRKAPHRRGVDDEENQTYAA